MPVNSNYTGHFNSREKGKMELSEDFVLGIMENNLGH